jgi:hypothetical protein
MNGRLKQKSTGLEQSGFLQNFSFLCQKCILHPLKKKLIKFTQISRTVWIFAKKPEISQNTENFHPCNQTITKTAQFCFNSQITQK